MPATARATRSHPARWQAVGGTVEDLDEHVELTELHLSEVLDYLARPAILESDPAPTR
jgi:hypothetical protein